jgi:hypothetical protein
MTYISPLTALNLIECDDFAKKEIPEDVRRA